MAKLKKFSVPELAAMAIVLIGAVVAAFGIRSIMNARVSLEEPPEPVIKTVAADAKPVADVAAPVIEPVAEHTEEVEQSWEDESPAQAAQAKFEPDPESEPADHRSTQELFESAFEDIDLTDEEEERLEKAIKLSEQWWGSLSENDRQQQIDRLRWERRQWDQMDAPQREAKLLEVRGQFDNWRRSGDDELPLSVLSTRAIQEGELEEFGIPKFFEER